MSDWKFAESPLDRRRPGGRHAGRARRGAGGARQDHRRDDLEGGNPRPGSGRPGRRRLLVGGDLERRRREAVRAAARPRRVGIRASDGAFLWGYNRVANDVANIPTPIVQGDFVFAASGYQTGSALLKLAPARGGKVTATEATSSTARRSRTITAASSWSTATSTAATATAPASRPASSSRRAR